jgi:phospholipid/cholesterol/gamma-HCH transport system substrate-binding protein
MSSQRSLETMVGVFVIAGLLALLVLALKVSGLTNYLGTNGYVVTAPFDNIGDLKVRSPVTVSGVRVGEVIGIRLDPTTFRANVTLLIDNKFRDLPVDSSAQILTQGLLGSNYISLTPGFQNHYLTNGSKIVETHPALILENLIGQLLYKVNGTSTSNTSSNNGSTKNS